jgi:HSP20 family protein
MTIRNHENQPSEARRAPPARTEQTRTPRAIAPAVDIYENEHELMLLADLPGVTRDGVNIQFEPERLTLEATRPMGETTLTYRRVFTVAPVFDAEKVTAVLERGVLQLRLPKSAAVKPRQIPVTVG